MPNSGRAAPTKTSLRVWSRRRPSSPGLWSISAHAQELLADAGYPTEAVSLDPALLTAALDAMRAHVAQEGDLRAHAIV